MALGLEPLELFVTDPVCRPFARKGLLWLLDGRHLVFLDASLAVVKCGDGARQTYRHSATSVGPVLVWELDR